MSPSIASFVLGLFAAVPMFGGDRLNWHKTEVPSQAVSFDLPCDQDQLKQKIAADGFEILCADGSRLFVISYGIAVKPGDPVPSYDEFLVSNLSAFKKLDHVKVMDAKISGHRATIVFLDLPVPVPVAKVIEYHNGKPLFLVGWDAAFDGQVDPLVLADRLHSNFRFFDSLVIDPK